MCLGFSGDGVAEDVPESFVDVKQELYVVFCDRRQALIWALQVESPTHLP